MWLLTHFGFFSIVQKPEDSASRSVTIRSRVKGDLETLRERYLPQMGEILENVGSDYKYRARVSKSDLAIALLQIGLDIDYSNFKNAVAEQQGPAREQIYHKLWDVLYQLQEAEDKPASKAKAKNPKAKAGQKLSFGGVLFDAQGRVLLRKPKNEFDDYVWTFAKGKMDSGASPEETALREVLEETGYQAKVIGKIPGSFAGGTGNTEYFLMRPVGEPQPFDPAETEAIEWVPPSKAAAYVQQTRNPIGRQRDLAVLKAAIAEYQKLGGGSA